jgi:hypothetical protein
VEMEVKLGHEESGDDDPINTPITPPAVDNSNDATATANNTAFEPTDFEPSDSGHNESKPTEMEQPLPSPIKSKPVTAAKPATEGTRKSSRVKQQVQSYVPSMKGKAYEYSAAQIQSIEHDPRVVEYVLTQLTLKAAVKMWGNNATIAAEAEMKQLHWRNSFRPVRWNELLEKKRSTILESHMFMKQKQSGEIKCRTVAGGNKQ